jgi:hypothetical protein
VPHVLTTIYDTLHALPGSLKLAIALAGPLIAVALFDAIGRRTTRHAKTAPLPDAEYEAIRTGRAFGLGDDAPDAPVDEASAPFPPAR